MVNIVYFNGLMDKCTICERAVVYIFFFVIFPVGADVNAKTSLGRTPLHCAASKGHGKVVDLLLEKGEYLRKISLL